MFIWLWPTALSGEPTPIKLLRSTLVKVSTVPPFDLHATTVDLAPNNNPARSTATRNVLPRVMHRGDVEMSDLCSAAAAPRAHYIYCLAS